MAQNPNAIRAALDVLVGPQARGRLLARGVARGMVWQDGVVPDGGPVFPENLTPDLLDFGYSVLALALELRDVNRGRDQAERFATDDAFTVAAEAIEAAVRRGDPNDNDQGRHLIVCAAAFHLAGFAARSFSMLPESALSRNLASPELALGHVLRRDLAALRNQIAEWLARPEHSDENIAMRLADEKDSFDPEDATLIVLTASYYRGLGLADTALLYGDIRSFASSIALLRMVVTSAATVGNVPMWWVATLTVHLLSDLWDQSLHVRLPSDPSDDLPDRWSGLRRDFIAQLSTRRPPHIELWPSQLTAASRAMDPADDLVIALPTSAGKTKIAELCILRALADEKRSVYVTPLRALSAQVERVLARTFVPLGATVTSLYGASGATSIDTESLGTAGIVVATPEKLDFALRQDPQVLDDVSLIIFDEGHMIGLGSREIRYEVLIQRLLRRSDASTRRIVCLSAMFNPDDPYFKDFGAWLRSDAPGDPVHVRWRPTRQRLATLDWNERSQTARLAFLEGEAAYVPRFLEGRPAQKKRTKSFPADELEFCIAAANGFARDGHKILVYSPQRTQVEKLVREFRHMHKQGYLTDVVPPKPEQIADALAIGREWLGEKHPAVLGLEIGVGTHHGALPRPFLTAVEELLEAKHLPIVVASPTLAQGIDLACSVLVFRSLTRFNAEAKKHVPISSGEFANVVGRAGRAFVDLDGISVVPSFESGWSRKNRHDQFDELIKESRGQRLLSGLAHLVFELASRISKKLGISVQTLLEYILNHSDLWLDPRLVAPEVVDEEDEITLTLDEYIADLDVALLSLIDPLDTPAESLSAVLDEVLRDSLWKRTLAHTKTEMQSLIREIMISRAKSLWQTTDSSQRQACFYAGLGRRAGVFLLDRLDDLTQLLVNLQFAIITDNEDDAGDLAVQFAELVMMEPFFSVRALPDDWKTVLKHWVTGIGFAEILAGRQTRDANRTQAFVQDGAVFRLVWAAEAVRTQAKSTSHPLAEALGDGPALALTYGVPSISAALLCQIGFASRIGAMWAVRKLGASFTNLDGMREWLTENNSLLSNEQFWESPDHYVLWTRASVPVNYEYPRLWKREEYDLEPTWTGTVPDVGARVRVITSTGRRAQLCSEDLTPLGHGELPFNPRGASIDAHVNLDGGLRVSYFGR